MTVSGIVLKRGWREVRKCPSLGEVLALMKLIEDDVAEDGAPEMSLDSLREGDGENDIAAVLLFMLAFDVNDRPSWLVQFIVPGTTYSPFLATHRPVSDLFVVRTSCGVVEKFRKECLLDRSEVIEKATAYFLEHGEMCPSLTWLPYEKVVHNA